MARELGRAKITTMLHHTEVEGADEKAKKLGATGKPTRDAMYEWWREKHPTEFDEASKTHHTGLTLAELTKSTA